MTQDEGLNIIPFLPFASVQADRICGNHRLNQALPPVHYVQLLLFVLIEHS
jgi:hypothetical protein